MYHIILYSTVMNLSSVCLSWLQWVFLCWLLSSTYQFSLTSVNSPHRPFTSNLDKLEPLLPHQCPHMPLRHNSSQQDSKQTTVYFFLPLINWGLDRWRCNIDLREQNSLKLLHEGVLMINVVLRDCFRSLWPLYFWMNRCFFPSFTPFQLSCWEFSLIKPSLLLSRRPPTLPLSLKLSFTDFFLFFFVVV